MPIKSLVKKEEQNHKFVNITKLLRKDNLTYDVETEIFLYARKVAEWWIKRYEQRHPNIHWKRGEKKNAFFGLLGQIVFEVVLDQKEIFHVSNNPLIEWNPNKPYDFLTKIGSIEVKTYPSYATKFQVKVKEWHKSDFVIAQKFYSPNIVSICGWLTGKQVEKLPISKKGEYYTPEADAYQCELTETNTDIEALFEKLREKTA